MNRRKFVNAIGKSIILLNVLPHLLPYLSKSKKDFLMGKSKNSHFKKIGNHYLEKQTALHFQKMQKAALNDGIQIQLVSAFRSFSRQKEIFESKFLEFQNSNTNQLEAIQQITKYSSIPGTSRHHWGTDVDVIQFHESNKHNQHVLNPSHFEKGGIFSDLHNWMQEHAASFGFYLTYTKDENRTGYQYEPWHYSYLPKAKPYLEEYLSQDMEQELISEQIEGLQNLDVGFFEKYISDYVLGINSDLK
jgi:LAS superfamily LD-carboxypeptidase LdcB